MGLKWRYNGVDLGPKQPIILRIRQRLNPIRDQSGVISDIPVERDVSKLPDLAVALPTGSDRRVDPGGAEDFQRVKNGVKIGLKWV